MRAILVPSSVRKPFGFLDRRIRLAMEHTGIRTRVIVPGDGFGGRIRLAVRDFRPRFLLATLGCRLSPQALETVASLEVPTAIWYTDDPYAIDQSLTTCGSFRYVFTVEERAVSVYREAGCARVFHLPLAAAVPVFSPRKVPAAYRSQVLILGSAFRNRLEEVDRIAPLLASRRWKIVGPGWHKLRSYQSLKECIRGRWVPPWEAARYYAGAQIVLNIHRAADDPHLDQNRRGIAADTPNNRTFEIAACRAYQLASRRRGLASLYPGGEVDSYGTAEELASLITARLWEPKRRSDLANRAFRLTMERHRYVHRIREILRQLAADGGLT